MRLAHRQSTLEFGRHDRGVAEPPAGAAARVAAITRLLPAEDRRLVEMLFVRGLSHRAAAAELNIAAGVVSRRVQRLRNLIASPTIRAIANHIDSLANPGKQIAIDHFFARTPISLIAVNRGLSRRDVQSQLDFIRGWARALHRAAVVATPTEEHD